MQVQVLEGLFDELQKIAASSRSAGYMQSRSGRRPIRAATLVNRGALNSTDGPNPPEDSSEQVSDATPVDAEGEKQAGDRTEKALGRFADARPYVEDAVKAGVPAAVLGNIYGGKRAARVLGTVGAAAGVANRGIQEWAEKNKRKRVARKLLED